MSRMKIYNMQVNHLSNPLGCRMERTVFSWKVTGSDGKKQTAASIQIAADANMKNLLADTGFQSEADSLGWQIDIPLSPCTRYFWQVTIRTDAAEEICSGLIRAGLSEAAIQGRVPRIYGLSARPRRRWAA